MFDRVFGLILCVGGRHARSKRRRRTVEGRVFSNCRRCGVLMMRDPNQGWRRADDDDQRARIIDLEPTSGALPAGDR